MTYLTGSDASDPKKPLPGEVACGYLDSNTPHPWTNEQWEMQTAKYLLPIYSADPGGNPVLAGRSAVAQMRSLKVPEGSAYAADIELLVPGDNLWLREFAAETAKAKYGCHPYRSASTIFTFEPRSGYWVADWTGEPHMYEHPFVKGTQWASDPAVDCDLFIPTMHFWENPYHGK